MPNKAAMLFISKDNDSTKHHSLIQTPSVEMSIWGVATVDEAMTLIKTLQNAGVSTLSLCPNFKEEDVKKMSAVLDGQCKPSRFQQLSLDTLETGLSDDFEQLDCLLRAGLQKAHELNEQVTISILDTCGHERISYRMPHALLISLDLAKKKAFSALAMKMPTHQLQALTQPGQSLYNLEAICGGSIVTFGGGIPLFTQTDELIGAIGVSGAMDPLDDDRIAQAIAHAYHT